MDYKALQERMVAEQLIPRGISNKSVLNAFRRVKRHEFVPEKLKSTAYADCPLPIGEGQTISQPYMVALMTEKLGLTGNEKVLEVGTGSGYQSAILAELAKEVYTIERFAPLLENAKETLSRLNYKNIEFKTDDGTLGWKEHAPFDRIIVTAGAPEVPKSLISQLAANGRMILPVGGGFSQALTAVSKQNGKVTKEEICGCVFVPLVGKEGWKKES